MSHINHSCHLITVIIKQTNPKAEGNQTAISGKKIVGQNINFLVKSLKTDILLRGTL
jgi:hypothetical protein